jgi:hypothetical protein
VIDATELGDLLELAGVEHVIGAESQAETGEPNALAGPADPLDQQSHSWVFAISYYPGEDARLTTARAISEYYKADFWPDRMLSWAYTDPITLETITRPIFIEDTDAPHGTDLWHFRRIAYRQHFSGGFYPSDIVIVNWPQLDYWIGQLAGVSAAEREKHLDGARLEPSCFDADRSPPPRWGPWLSGPQAAG